MAEVAAPKLCCGEEEGARMLDAANLVGSQHKFWLCETEGRERKRLVCFCLSSPKDGFTLSALAGPAVEKLAERQEAACEYENEAAGGVRRENEAMEWREGEFSSF